MRWGSFGESFEEAFRWELEPEGIWRELQGCVRVVWRQRKEEPEGISRELKGCLAQRGAGVTDTAVF